MLSRRALLLGTSSTLAVGAAGGVGIQQGVLPGRPWLQGQLRLNGGTGGVPDVEPGPVARGSFVSAARLGAPTRWALARPPGITGPLPLVVALHAYGHDVETLLGPGFGLPQHLAAAVAAGAPPFQVAMADGGTTYWHERPDGEDAGAMIVDGLLPLLQERDVPTEQVGLIGWSMGGFGALHLAGILGSDRVPAAVATSAAIWTECDERDPARVRRRGRVGRVHALRPPGRPRRHHPPARLRHGRPVLPRRRGLRRGFPRRRRRHRDLRAWRTHRGLLAPRAAGPARLPRRRGSLAP
ncbi:hypothetical protein [Nocardioides psychrotolerans]|uniref:hypothetical protein n=1 Tax=Nocardioides psychrotolerans TaxID=1005945 RepID=UPI000B874EF3|nr:hypothetical protein [Nocardioides psychrotolerans]